MVLGWPSLVFILRCIIDTWYREPKRGRLQSISRGFHRLDVWTVVLSDSPWTANRRSQIFLVLYAAYFVVREEGMGWGGKTLMEE